MLKEFFSQLLGRKPVQAEESEELGPHILYGWNKRPPDKTITFVCRERNIRRPILGGKREIFQFPGIAEPEEVLKHMESEQLPGPTGQFGFHVERKGSRFLVLWTIQPDGRYWADEGGFGGTNDLEVQLYTYLDADGRYTGPFRLYKVGRDMYDTPPQDGEN